MKDYCLGLYEKAMPSELPWEERFCAAQEAGFDFIEMSIDESEQRLARLRWDQKERKEFVRRMAENGGAVRSICLSAHRRYPIGSSVPDTERKGMEIMRSAIALAADLGVRIIQLAGYDVYYGEASSVATKERFLENLYISTLEASKHEVILALETMENEFMNTVEKAMYYVREIHSPYLQVYPDIGNVTNGTENVTYDIRMGRGHIAAVHLKETKEGIFRDLSFGEGRVDFGTTVRCLKKLGVRSFTAELWHNGEDEWRHRLCDSYHFLAQYLGQVIK